MSSYIRLISGLMKWLLQVVESFEVVLSRRRTGKWWPRRFHYSLRGQQQCQPEFRRISKQSHSVQCCNMSTYIMTYFLKTCLTLLFDDRPLPWMCHIYFLRRMKTSLWGIKVQLVQFRRSFCCFNNTLIVQLMIKIERWKLYQTVLKVLSCEKLLRSIKRLT